MTDEQLTALAIEAKVEAYMEDLRWLYDQIVADERNQYLDKLAEAVDLSVKAEREQCAKVCDEWNWSSKHGSHPSGQLGSVAAAIRARGEK